jgi:hypothetical protein
MSDILAWEAVFRSSAHSRAGPAGENARSTATHATGRTLASPRADPETKTTERYDKAPSRILLPDRPALTVANC